MSSKRAMNLKSRTVGAARFGIAAFCVGLLSALPLYAEGPAFPVLPRGSAVLVLPKGKPVTVGGMTLKGGAPAPEPTAITLDWNDEGLTVVFDCTDTAVAAEWAEERDSTRTWKDDSVAVLLDVGHRHAEADNLIMFKLSVAGGLQDCRGKNRDIAFNVAGVTSEVTLPAVPIAAWRIMPVTPEQIKASQSPVPPNHWRGTIRIPWKGLGVSPKEGEAWGVNFTRIDQPGKYDGTQNMKFMAWAPFADDFEGVQYFGHLVFAAKDAATDEASLAASREAANQAHARIAAETVFPNEGNVLIVPAKQPVSAGEFRVAPSGAAPKQPTTVAVSWSPAGLDFVFDCVDDGMVADQKGHDNIKLWKDDSVYVWLDLGHAHNAERQLLMVQVSAGGECHDTRNGDLKFDIAGLVVEAARTNRGWRAHLLMPWAGLGVACPKPGEVWGINLTRMDQPGKLDYANMQTSSWAAIPDGDLTTLDRWGHLVFVEAAGGAAGEDLSVAAGRQAISKSHEARQQAIRLENGL